MWKQCNKYQLIDGLCPSCYFNREIQCIKCGKKYRFNQMIDGLCPTCFTLSGITCKACGKKYHNEQQGNGLCPICNWSKAVCNKCGNAFPKAEIEKGLCYNCREGQICEFCGKKTPFFYIVDNSNGWCNALKWRACENCFNSLKPDRCSKCGKKYSHAFLKNGLCYYCRLQKCSKCGAMVESLVTGSNFPWGSCCEMCYKTYQRDYDICLKCRGVFPKKNLKDGLCGICREPKKSHETIDLSDYDPTFLTDLVKSAVKGGRIDPNGRLYNITDYWDRVGEIDSDGDIRDSMGYKIGHRFSDGTVKWD